MSIKEQQAFSLSLAAYVLTWTAPVEPIDAINALCKADRDADAVLLLRECHGVSGNDRQLLLP